jgi:hypothetical protein
MSANPQLLTWIEKLRAHRGFCRWVHLICFWSWLISAEGIGPAACAWLASLDQVHQVVVCAEANGPVQVILTHESEAAHLEPHGPLVDALLVMGQASSEQFKDHVLSFHALDDGRRSDAIHLEKPAFMMVQLPLVRFAHAIHPRSQPMLKWDMATLARQTSHPRRVMRC